MSIEKISASSNETGSACDWADDGFYHSGVS